MIYVSINGHTIRKNAVLGTDDPPIRIARTKSEVVIDGPSRLLYSPAKPILRCGARLVLETDEVYIVR